MSRRRKLIIAGLLVVLVLTVFFMSHYVQLNLMERVSLKTLIVRMLADSQNLNLSSPLYGSLLGSSWFTMEAVDALSVLGALSFIDAEAVVQFLVGPNQSGPVDRPIWYPSDAVFVAFIVTHTISALGRLNELPSSLVAKIHEIIIANQNSSSTKDYLWAFDRAFFLETARLMNETRYVNSTFQRQEVLDDIVNYIWRDSGGLSGVLNWLNALQELYRIGAGYQMPDVTRNMLEFYILSLWDDSRYGFYESPRLSNPMYYRGSISSTYRAIRSYMALVGYWDFTEKDALNNKVGYSFEKVLTFLNQCQNRYGILFDTPREVSNKINSLQWTTPSAIMLLHDIDRMDFLNQTVRWPPNPTLIENLGDRFNS